MQNTIIAIDKIVTPLGLNLQDSNLRTKVPSKGALAYEQDTALLYYGNDSDWILLSAGGLNITGPTGSMGLSITGPTGSMGLSITGPTGSMGLSITGPTGSMGLSITGPTGSMGLSITGPTGSGSSPIYPNAQIVFGDGSSPGGVTSSNLRYTSNVLVLNSGDIQLDDTFGIDLFSGRIYHGSYTGSVFGDIRGVVNQVGTGVNESWVVTNTANDVAYFEVNAADGQLANSFLSGNGVGLISVDNNGVFSFTSSVSPSLIAGTPTRVPYYDAITGILTDDANHTIDNSTNGNTNFEATDGSNWTSQLTANQIGAGLTFNNLTTATDAALSANNTALNAIVTDSVTLSGGFNIGLDQHTYAITNLSNLNQTGLVINDQQVYLGVIQGFSQQGTSIVMDDTMTSIIIQDRATGTGGNCGIFYNGQDSTTPYQINFFMTDESGFASGSFANTGNIFQFLQGGVYSQLIQQQGLFEVAVNDGGATFNQNLTMNSSNVTLSFDSLTDGINGAMTMSDVTAQFNFTDGATFSDNLTEDGSHIQLTYQDLITNIQTGINGTGSEAQLKYQDFTGGIVSYTQVDGVQHTSNYTDGINFQSQCTLDSGQALLAYANVVSTVTMSVQAANNQVNLGNMNTPGNLTIVGIDDLAQSIIFSGTYNNVASSQFFNSQYLTDGNIGRTQIGDISGVYGNNIIDLNDQAQIILIGQGPAGNGTDITVNSELLQFHFESNGHRRILSDGGNQIDQIGDVDGVFNGPLITVNGSAPNNSITHAAIETIFNSGVVYNILSINATQIIPNNNSYYYIDIDSTVGVVNITLPMASSQTAGRTYVFTDAQGVAGVHSINIQTQGLDTIRGSNTISISTNYGSLTIHTDGVSNWVVT